MKKENLSPIFLIGLPGSGKTTLGKLLARERGLNFIDLDDYIEEKSGMKISYIFKKYGEDYFRELEHRALFECSKITNTVIATGGGVVVNPANRKILKESKNVIYIKRDCEDIIKNTDLSSRPLLKYKPERIYELFEARSQYYENICTSELENSTSLKNSLDKLLKLY